MSTVAIALILKPLGALILFGLICLPIRLAVQRWMPECWLKRALLLKVKSSVST